MREIAPSMHRAGLYRILLAEWLPELRESADDWARSAALNWSGMYHQALGEYDVALKYLEQSLSIYQEIGNRVGGGGDAQ